MLQACSLRSEKDKNCRTICANQGSHVHTRALLTVTEDDGCARVVQERARRNSCVTRLRLHGPL
jgi:hypothetical protein